MTKSAKVMHVSNADGSDWDFQGFGALLTRLRDEAGIASDAELAERVRQIDGGIPSFNASTVSKWRAGAPPSTKFLRAVARVLKVAPMRLFLAADAVLRTDFDDRPIDPVYEELLAFDEQLESHELEVARTDLLYQLRSHVLAVVGGTRLQVDQLMRDAGHEAPPRRRRRLHAHAYDHPNG